MSLTEALLKSHPRPPTQQIANTRLYGKGSVSVAYDGRFWDVLWLGSPFGFETKSEVEAFLEQEGIPLHDGWLPQATGNAPERSIS